MNREYIRVGKCATLAWTIHASLRLRIGQGIGK